MITYGEACERVLRHCRLSIANSRARIHVSKDYVSHWSTTYAVPSLEDPSRIFKYASVVVEKNTGHLFHPSSRGPQVDIADLTSIRQHFGRITTDDMEMLEKERETK